MGGWRISTLAPSSLTLHYCASSKRCQKICVHIHTANHTKYPWIHTHAVLPHDRWTKWNFEKLYGQQNILRQLCAISAHQNTYSTPTSRNPDSQSHIIINTFSGSRGEGGKEGGTVRRNERHTQNSLAWHAVFLINCQNKPSNE